MIRIALIDDDDDTRDSLVKIFESHKFDDWEILSQAPLTELREYPEWIRRERIDALVIDWKLNQRTPEGRDGPVSYVGTDLVRIVREHLPFLPIFVMTAYALDDDVREHGAEVETISGRDDFLAQEEHWVPRIRRSAGRYSEAQRGKLRRLSELAQGAAIGDLEEDAKTELRALQMELHAGVDADATLAQGSLLADATAAIAEAERLLAEIDDAAREND